MKKLLLTALVLGLCLYIFLHSPDYVIKGRYTSAPDCTKLYIAPYLTYDIEKALVPVDSAVVSGGRFEFSGDVDGLKVCFVSSSQVVDGGFVVVEPGEAQLSFDNGVVCRGTAHNEELSRFIDEKHKIEMLNRMLASAESGRLAVESSMCDSIKELVSLATMVFDAYAVRLIKDNIDNELGHFYLTQSVGIVSSKKLVNFFLQVPEVYRDKLYESYKARVENGVVEEMSKAEYTASAAFAASVTSVGKKYIDFALERVSDGVCSLSRTVSAGKYTLLAFWAGWNSESVRGMADISSLYADYEAKGFRFVSVSLDDNPEELHNAVASKGLKGDLLFAPDGGSAEVASFYGVSSLPEYILINREGTIIARSSSVADIKNKIEEVF